MAATSLIEIRGQIIGLGVGTRNISISLPQNANAPSQVTQVFLVSGDNTITVPTNARGCIIQFHPTSTVNKTLKGAGADTGIPLETISGTHLLHFRSTPPASFIINSAAAEPNIPTEITFF